MSIEWSRYAIRFYVVFELGRVTHAANHHEVVDTSVEGGTVKRTIRDSVEAPRRVRDCKPRSSATPMPVLPAAAVARPISPWQATAEGSSRTRRACPRAAAAKAAEEANMQRRVQEIGCELQPAVGRQSAQERTAALQARVIARIGAAPAASE